MPKSYLITLTQTDLQSIIFQTVDRAIKINRITSNPNDIQLEHSQNQATESTGKKISKRNKEEVCNG